MTDRGERWAHPKVEGDPPLDGDFINALWLKSSIFHRALWDSIPSSSFSELVQTRPPAGSYIKIVWKVSKHVWVCVYIANDNYVSYGFRDGEETGNGRVEFDDVSVASRLQFIIEDITRQKGDQ